MYNSKYAPVCKGQFTHPFAPIPPKVGFLHDNTEDRYWYDDIARATTTNATMTIEEATRNDVGTITNMERTITGTMTIDAVIDMM